MNQNLVPYESHPTLLYLHSHEMARCQLHFVGVEILDESSDEMIGYGRHSLQLNVRFDEITQNVGALDSLQRKTLALAHAHWEEKSDQN